jgi:short-subunit dehydrogenase
VSHVAITGASSGIGEAIAREYLRRGARVTLVARRRALLEGIAACAPGRAHVVARDLGDPAEAASWLPAAEAALGPIDVLVNNAGVNVVGRTAAIAWDEIDAVLRLDLVAPLRILRAVLPGMIERGGGAVVNIASVAALAPPPGMFAYSAAKGGLAAASESLRAELRGTGVRVVTVYPGPIPTDLGLAAAKRMKETLGTRLMPWGTSAELARRVADAVDRGCPRVVYPRFYGLSRWFGPLARWVTDRGAAPVS